MKIGDYVISTRIEYPDWIKITRGKEYKVLGVEIDDDSDVIRYITIINDDGKKTSWSVKEFRLAPKDFQTETEAKKEEAVVVGPSGHAVKAEDVTAAYVKMMERKAAQGHPVDPVPNVQLIDYTGKGFKQPDQYAAAVLAYTRNTRLDMTAKSIDEWFSNTPSSALMEELVEVSRTIPSSWEFVDYTFIVPNVTRAFTHQFVRSRHMSFAQQTMRTLKMEGWTYGTGPSIWANDSAKRFYDTTMAQIGYAYKHLLKIEGVKPEDARGILPTNIHTNIVVKMNLRTFAETYRKRTSARIQDEYVNVMHAMYYEIKKVHPWIDLFVQTDRLTVLAELESFIKEISLVKMRDRGLKLLHRLREI